MYGSLAQSVEQRTVNPCVAGSSPARAAKTFLKLREVFFCPFWNNGFTLTNERSLQRHSKYNEVSYTIKIANEVPLVP